MHQSLGLAVGLFVLAQRYALLDDHMGATPISGSVPLWSRMWGAHTGIPECLMEPLLHAFVPDDFVQFRIPTGFNVSICTINGFAGKTGLTLTGLFVLIVGG